MYPLRKNYVRTLMKEVGFQQIATYGDFQETYRQTGLADNDEILKVCSQDYIDRMKVGLNHWIESGKKGYLAWGILHFRH